MRFFLSICLLGIATLTTLGQSIQIKNVDTQTYPKVAVKVADRNPEAWKAGLIQIAEDDIEVNDLTFTEVNPQKRPQKKVFILFENSHFASFDAQRAALKELLQQSLTYFSEKDLLYFSEFDWTLANGKVLRSDKIYEGDKEYIAQLAEAIKRPEATQKTHESTELNTALMEALDYLQAVPEDSLYEKAVLLFSAEFSNIYNSIHTPESIILSARQKNIPIYTVRYPRMGAKYSLKKITEETFGEHFEYDLAKNPKERAEALGKNIENLTSRSAGHLYELTYTSSKGPGSQPVALTLSKAEDPLRVEALFTTPSYLSYILMDPLRIGMASGALLLVLGLLFALVSKKRKRKQQDQEENEKKLQQIQEDAKRELDKQERMLEKLENDQRSQRQKEQAHQEELALKQATQASNERFNQLLRAPILIGQDGTQYSLGMINGLGRTKSPQNSLILPDATVSREHALILFERRGLDQLPEPGQAFFFLDLGSSNGSYINEQQVQAAVSLKNGDFIRLGNLTLTFRQ
jgi:hypothetical protein